MNEFDWIIETPTYITLVPDTVYHFPPDGKTVEEFSERINPIYGELIHWMEWANEGEDGLKYFVLDEVMEIDGWCDVTTVEEAQEYYHHGECYSYVDINTFFG